MSNIKGEAPQNEELTSEKKEEKVITAGKNSKQENDKASELEKREKAIQEREKAVEIREKNAELKEQELVALQETLSAAPISEKLPGLEFDLDDEKFKFLDDAPKEILFAGKSRSQKSLINDVDALVQLVSNSSLIQKIS